MISCLYHILYNSCCYILYLSSHVALDGCVQYYDKYVCEDLPQLSRNKDKTNGVPKTILSTDVAPC